MNSPSSIEPRTTTSPEPGPDVLHRRPVGQVGEEVRDHVVLDPAAEHVERRRLALVERHVPVLDPQRPAVHHAVVLADVAGGVDARRRALEPGAALHAARLADLEPGGLRQRHVRASRRSPITTMSHSSSSPPFVTTLRHPLAVALEALELVAAVDLDAVLLEHALEEPADLLAERRSKVTSSCITIAHFTPCAAVSDAATSHADVAAADQHRPLVLLRVGADRVRVAERAQVVDPVELAAVDAQPPHVRAGGEQRLARTRPRPWSTASPPRSASSFITLVRVSSSMRCSSHHSSGRNSTSSFDSLPCR